MRDLEFLVLVVSRNQYGFSVMQMRSRCCFDLLLSR